MKQNDNINILTAVFEAPGSLTDFPLSFWLYSLLKQSYTSSFADEGNFTVKSSKNFSK